MIKNLQILFHSKRPHTITNMNDNINMETNMNDNINMETNMNDNINMETNMNDNINMETSLLSNKFFNLSNYFISSRPLVKA
jgi:long-subunit fatty acid transport protein